MPRTGRPGRVKWTAEQDDTIRKLYSELGPQELAKRLNVPVDCCQGRARYLGIKYRVVYQWTKEQLRILKTRYVTDGPARLSKELNIPYWVLLSKAKRMGIEATRKTPPKDFEWTSPMIEAIKQRYVSEGGDKLSKEFGLSLGTVRRKASELGLHTNAGHVRWGQERAESSSSCNIAYFDSWSPNMAYVLGFLFADGSVSKHLITVGVVRDDEAVIQFIKKELQAKQRIKHWKGGFISGRNCRPQSRLAIGSTVLIEQLAAIGLKPRKTFNDDPFPDVPDTMMPHFVRGYLDGDGCVCIGAGGACGVSFVGSPKFITGLHDALVRLIDAKPQTIQIKKGRTTDWASVCWSSLKDLEALYEFVYPKGYGFCLERKRKKLEEWLSVPRWSKGHYYPRKNKNTESLMVTTPDSNVHDNLDVTNANL